MKKVFMISVLFVLVSCSYVSGSERPERMISLGGGGYGGMVGAAAEMMFSRSENQYFRVGLAVTDSKNLYPSQDWRRFAPLYVDGILYFPNNTYVGGGLNYPLKVSDGDIGDIGYQLFYGADIYANERSKIYSELGYSVIRRLSQSPYAGLSFIVGWRYDIILGTAKANAGEKVTSSPASTSNNPSEIIMPSVKDNMGPEMIKEKKAENEGEANANKEPEEIRAVIDTVKVEKVARSMPDAKPMSSIKKRMFHYISKGDTLVKISRKYFLSQAFYKEIAKTNNIRDPNRIVAGNYLLIYPDINDGHPK